MRIELLSPYSYGRKNLQAQSLLRIQIHELRGIIILNEIIAIRGENNPSNDFPPWVSLHLE